MGRLGYLPDWKIISSRNPHNAEEMRVSEEDKGGQIWSLMTGKNVYPRDRWSCTKRYERCGVYRARRCGTFCENGDEMT